jgi:sulfocyanin
MIIMFTRNGAIRAAAVCLVAAGSLGIAQTTAGAAKHAAAPNWLSYDAKSKTAKLTVIAGYGGGFDFNGYQKGKLTVTVPLNTKVTVTFSNAASIAHSVEFVPFSKSAPATAPAPAFKGAASASYMAGVTSSAKPQTFSFIANKAGKYLMICAVPGHALAGMWDNFVVDAKAKAASLAVSK